MHDSLQDLLRTDSFFSASQDRVLGIQPDDVLDLILDSWNFRARQVYLFMTGMISR